ncbi:MAG: hypothetical protein FJX54_12985 [Alphaproteobacteria bacterium]|nr:hypothetical protein [Alphaproteobacteria bacterium]
MKIAALLPTLFPDLARGAIESLAVAFRTFDHAEIVVVSPTRIDGPRVKWIEESEPRGVTQAQSTALAATDADIVFAVTDDVRVRPDAIAKAVDFVTVNEPRAAPYVVGLNFIRAPHLPHGSVGVVYGLYYPFFPLARRRTIDVVGWFDTAYHSFWADPDLGLRVWHSPGGRCEMSPGCVELIADRDKQAEAPGRTQPAVWQRDMATFLARWGDSIGRGWSRELKAFNDELMPDGPLEHGIDRTGIATLHASLAAAARRAPYALPAAPADDGTPRTGTPLTAEGR